MVQCALCTGPGSYSLYVPLLDRPCTWRIPSAAPLSWLSTHVMVALTELEDSLDTLLKVMASAIAYTSRKASHRQVHPQVPLTTLGNTEGLAPDVMAASRDELVADLITQAKDVQRRIQELPATDDSDEAQVCTVY